MRVWRTNAVAYDAQRYLVTFSFQKYLRFCYLCLALFSLHWIDNLSIWERTGGVVWTVFFLRHEKHRVAVEYLWRRPSEIQKCATMDGIDLFINCTHRRVITRKSELRFRFKAMDVRSGSSRFLQSLIGRPRTNSFEPTKQEWPEWRKEYFSCLFFTFAHWMC